MADLIARRTRSTAMASDQLTAAERERESYLEGIKKNIHIHARAVSGTYVRARYTLIICIPENHNDVTRNAPVLPPRPCFQSRSPLYYIYGLTMCKHC